MRASFFVLLSLLFVCSCQEPPVESYAVIPQPAEIAYTPGFVKLKQQPVVAYSPALANEAQMLKYSLGVGSVCLAGPERGIYLGSGFGKDNDKSE